MPRVSLRREMVFRGGDDIRRVHRERERRKCHSALTLQPLILGETTDGSLHWKLERVQSRSPSTNLK